MAVRPRVARGRGRHALRSKSLAAELVRAAGILPGDLVLDLGAGTGVLTGALVRAGARAVAIEIDAVFAAALRGRFEDVVEADALDVALPREPFKVVANLPFHGSTAILRRLLGPREPLISADVIVEWGLAVKRAAVWPSTQLGSYWGAWFELSLVRRLPPSVFAPPPPVDAAVLRAVRRAEPLVPPREGGRYWAFLARGYKNGPRAVVRGPALKRLALDHGFDRQAQGRDLDVRQWADLYRATRDRSLRSWV